MADPEAMTTVPPPAYVPVRKGDVAETREMIEGQVFADFDAAGTLLGIRVLAPMAVPIHRAPQIDWDKVRRERAAAYARGERDEDVGDVLRRLQDGGDF